MIFLLVPLLSPLALSQPSNDAMASSQATASDSDVCNLLTLAEAAIADAEESSWAPGPASLAMDASTVAANRVPPPQGPWGGRSAYSIARIARFAPEQPQHLPRTAPSAVNPACPSCLTSGQGAAALPTRASPRAPPRSARTNSPKRAFDNGECVPWQQGQPGRGAFVALGRRARGSRQAATGREARA